MNQENRVKRFKIPSESYNMTAQKKRILKTFEQVVLKDYLFWSFSILDNRSSGIESILNVGTGIENRFPDRIAYSTVELLDLPEQDLTPGSHFL